MNPYYYLFYKLTRFLNKKGNNEWGVIYAISIITGIPVIYSYIEIMNISPKSFEDVHKYLLIIISIIIFILNATQFTNKNRVEKIVKRYQSESIVQKKLGSIAVLLYAILTIAFIIFA
jgi:uncharacterized membrane protein